MDLIRAGRQTKGGYYDYHIQRNTTYFKVVSDCVVFLIRYWVASASERRVHWKEIRTTFFHCCLSNSLLIPPLQWLTWKAMQPHSVHIHIYKGSITEAHRVHKVRVRHCVTTGTSFRALPQLEPSRDYQPNSTCHAMFTHPFEHHFGCPK